jgi:hypothetical protein
MFRIVAGKGFQLTFSNGWTVSVQFGSGNYCERRQDEWNTKPEDLHSSKDAEFAAWDKDGVWLSADGDEVKGYCSSDEVAAFIEFVSKLNSDHNKQQNNLLMSQRKAIKINQLIQYEIDHPEKEDDDSDGT